MSVAASKGPALVVLIAAALCAQGCENKEDAPAVRRLPPELLKGAPAASTPEQKPEPDKAQDAAKCAAPFKGLDMLKAYNGLDQLTYPVFVPKTYDPSAPPPLVLLATDRYFDVPAWLPRADLMSAADEHGFIVLVVSRMMSQTTGSDLKAPVQALRKVVCFDEDRIYAIGAGSGADAVADAACNGDVAKIVTSGGRPDPPCAEVKVPHLHIVSLEDQTLPLAGAASRELSKHESRIKEQNQTLTIIGRQLDRKDLAATKDEGPTPCPPPEGVKSLDDFVAGWCNVLGCVDTAPEKLSDACTVQNGTRAKMQVCRVDGGRPWTPSNPPYASCYGAPPPRSDYTSVIWSFLAGD